jgi:hypothetical protein
MIPEIFTIDLDKYENCKYCHQEIAQHVGQTCDVCAECAERLVERAKLPTGNYDGDSAGPIAAAKRYLEITQNVNKFSDAQYEDAKQELIAALAKAGEK